MSLAPSWLCGECRKPAPDRIPECDCPTSRLSDETGQFARKIRLPWGYVPQSVCADCAEVIAEQGAVA